MSALKDDFFWGNSVSSMQTEGGWNEGGKGLSVYDIRPATENASDWHFANDNYHHYEEDFDLMKDLGMNIYRFQISWSRVNPEGDGEFNEEGLLYYDHFIDDLIERGIEPMICLYHFDMPLHLAEVYGGFTSKHVTEAFIRFGKKMIDRYAGKVKWWITFNEQNLYSTEWAWRFAGAENAERSRDNRYQIIHNIMYAHASLSNYLQQTTDAKIGGMLAIQENYPASCHPKDIKAVRNADEFLNQSLLEAFAGQGMSPLYEAEIRNGNLQVERTEEEMAEINSQKSDFLSFSYYCSSTLDHTKAGPEVPLEDQAMAMHTDNPYLETTEWNWQIDPDGFRDVLSRMYWRYRIPVFPIENGIGVRESWDGENPIEDDYRIDYHRSHIQATKDAVEKDGADVIGYLGWGLIDILSSQGDMEKRYGVVYVNRGNHDLRDMKRVPKKSYSWMKKAIHSNGEDLD